MQAPAIQAQLDALAAFPEELRQQLEGQPEEALRYRPAPDAWSVMEILGFLTVFGARWANRIRMMLAAQNPSFVRPNDEDLVKQADFQSKPLDQVLADFAERRTERVQFMRNLHATDLARTATHNTRGMVTIADGIAILVDTDRTSRDQIAKNLELYRQAAASG